MKWSNININRQYGFTLLEVMVALAIMGVAVAIFFNIIGNSSKLRGRIDEHAAMVVLARTKTEEAFLGVLGDPNIVTTEKSSFEGTTKDGVKWKVSASEKIEKKPEEADEEVKEKMKEMEKTSKDKDKDAEEKLSPIKISQLNTQVGAISIDTIILSRQSPEGLTKSSQPKRPEKTSPLENDGGGGGASDE
jgi:general secretion pathway protein I